MKNTLLILLLAYLNYLIPVHAQITPWEASALMQKGINLGNTLEPPLEGGWNNPAAQEYYFDLYKEAGFSTVRIPVRWDEHTQDTSPYKIDDSWLQRVETIIDWGLERDLFIVVNAHHDDWIKQNYTNADYRARFDSIWSQIAVRFRNKSEKLFFEILNEPNGLTKAQNDEMHQRVLSIIRITNPARIVIIQGHNWGGSDELIAAAIPDDDYIMGSFHSYDPYLFGLEGQGTWGTAADYTALQNKFTSVKNWSDTTNIPVFLGEFGSLRTCDYNSRMKHYRAYVELSQHFGFVSCAWDDGGYFRIMERESHQWDEVKDILIHTTSSAPRNLALIAQDTIIKLGWTNVGTDIDSIFVEHRTATGSWERIASLRGDTTAYDDVNPEQELYHHYRIIASYADTQSLYSQPQRIYMPKYEPKIRSYYLGVPLSIPGVIEAEDFDKGGEGLTYHDFTSSNQGNAYRLEEGVDIFDKNGDGFIIGSIMTGEWCEYSVDVEEAGLYKIDFNVSALLSGGTFKIVIDTIESHIIKVPNTGSRLIINTVSDTMDLPAGETIMRLTITDDKSSSYNIDKLVFTEIETITGVSGLPVEDISIRTGPNNMILLTSEKLQDIQSMKIFTITGNLVYSLANPEINKFISTPALAKGIYLISIVTNKQQFSEKVIFK